MILSYFTEARRIFGRRLKIIFTGVKEYDGDDAQICWRIIEDCYNKKKEYFMTSCGHFSEFYARDFGWTAKSLVRLGYKERVQKTLDYALDIYQKYGVMGKRARASGLNHKWDVIFDRLMFQYQNHLETPDSNILPISEISLETNRVA